MCQLIQDVSGQKTITKTTTKEKRKKRTKNHLTRIGICKLQSKVTVRGAENIASELIALVCSIKFIAEGSFCPNTEESVLLAEVLLCKDPNYSSRRVTRYLIQIVHE